VPEIHKNVTRTSQEKQSIFITNTS